MKSSKKSEPRQQKKSLYLWLVLFAGLAVAYAPTFGNGFVYDDHDLILRNPLVIGHEWVEIWQKDLWGETPRLASVYYRPLVATSFAIEHLIYGENSFGYHLDNLLLHCLAVFLLFFVARDLLRKGKQGATAAFVAVFLYAFHPANTQIVYWVSARGDLLVTIAVLVGLYCVGKNGKLHLTGTIMGCFLALFSKETGVLYLLLVPLSCFLFCDKSTRIKQIRSRLIAMAPVVLVYVLLRFSAVPLSVDLISDEAFWRPSDGLAARFLTMPAIWGFYLLRAVFPYYLNFETGIYLFSSVLDWQFMAGLVSIIAGIVLFLRFKKNTLAKWAFVFWLVSLLPFLNIVIATFESGMEHYLYLPLVAFSILVAAILPGKQITRTVFGVVILSFAVTTFVRGSVWRDDISLWRDAVNKTGSDCRQGWVRSRANLGRAHLGLARDNIDVAQNLESAELLYKEVVGAYTNDGSAWNGLGDVYFERQDYNLAQSHYQKAVEFRPYDYVMRNKLGVAVLRQKKFDEAAVHYQAALELKPDYPGSVLNLAAIRVREGKLAEAEELLRRLGESRFGRYEDSQTLRFAIELLKGRELKQSPTEKMKVVFFLDDLGLYAAEAKLLNQMYADDPNDANVLYKLSMLHMFNLRQPDVGIDYLRDGIKKHPNDFRFLRAMALVYANSGEKEKAANMVEQILQRFPNHPETPNMRDLLKSLGAQN